MVSKGYLVRCNGVFFPQAFNAKRAEPHVFTSGGSLANDSPGVNFSFHAKAPTTQGINYGDFNFTSIRSSTPRLPFTILSTRRRSLYNTRSSFTVSSNHQYQKALCPKSGVAYPSERSLWHPEGVFQSPTAPHHRILL